MLQSMTGYGEATVGNVHCEVKTLNHRFFDITINIPAFLSSYEFKTRSLLKKRLERGAVILKLSLDSPQFKLDVKGAKEHYKFLKQLNKTLGTDFKVSLDTFLGFKKAIPPSWRAVEKALLPALNALIKTRVEEGQKLEKNIRLHLKQAKKVFFTIKERTPRPEERKTQFKEKIAKFTKKTIDEHKLMDEFAFLLIKEDFNEEQVRFEAHLKAFEKNIESKKSSGKYLVFLTQEMYREVNTIASKIKSPNISSLIVKLKSELEKIREQTENVK